MESFPPNYGYVLLSATLSACVGYYHALTMISHRRAAKVPYPNAYCTAAEAKESREKYLFNCAQRAHANFLEHQPQFLIHLLVSGLRFPIFSASLGLLWNIARIHYARGYLNPNAQNGEGRTVGVWFGFPQMGLLVGSVVSALGMTGLGQMMGTQIMGLVGR